MQFAFSPLNRKIDWRQLAFIDIEKVIDDVDLNVLEENLANISLCDIAQEMTGYNMNRCFINLFKLAQLIIQYLLFMQRILTNKIKELRALCEAKLNNKSSNAKDARQTHSEHFNQPSADHYIPVHASESQERAQRRHTDERELMRSEIGRTNRSQSEFQTDAGLRTKKHSQEKHFGTSSQKSQQLSNEEFGNQQNCFSDDVSDPKKLQEEIVSCVKRTKENISVIATKLNDFITEPGTCENEITAVQDYDQSLETFNARSPNVVLQTTAGSFTTSSISPSGSTVKRDLAKRIRRRNQKHINDKFKTISDV